MTSPRFLTILAIGGLGFAAVVLTLTLELAARAPGSESLRPGSLRPGSLRPGSPPAETRARTARAPTGATPEEQAPQRGPNVRPQEPTPGNKFLEGWMEELLYGNRVAARKAYTEAMESKTPLPGFQAELATARLRESTWRKADRRKYRDVLAGMERTMRTATGVATVTLDLLDGLLGEFATALQSNGHGLIDLRAKLQAQLQSSPGDPIRLRDPRRLLTNIIKELRGEQKTSDPELERLKAAHKQARESGDGRAAYRAWRQIQTRHFVLSRQGDNRIQGKRWASITRFHLAGEHRRAYRSEKYLRLRRRFSQTQRPHEEVLASIDRMNAEQRIEKARQVMANLDPRARWLRAYRYNVSAEDKKVLAELQTRLAKLIESGAVDKALRLAAQVPYRDPLFRVPRPRTQGQRGGNGPRGGERRR